MFVRKGKRVNVVTGGRIAKGDKLLIGKNGHVEIRFDDPNAGPGGSGTLIAGQGRYTIDADPVKKKPNVTVTVIEGAARFIRPAGGTPMDVAMTVEGGVFGQLAGTDVIAIRNKGPNSSILAVREGQARVQVLQRGRIATGYRSRDKWQTITAGHKILVSSSGRSWVHAMPAVTWMSYVTRFSLKQERGR